MSGSRRFLMEWLSELSEGKPLRAVLGILLIGGVLLLAVIAALLDPGLRRGMQARS
jgi:hypothetical protein